MHPQDPPPHPQQPQYPVQYPAAQYPPAQAYPPYPAPQYPGAAQPYPGYGYPQPYQPPHQPPPKRTEFGWASIVVASIALLTCWVPYFNMVATAAAILVVLAGWVGKHERSRVPAAFGAGIAVLALIGTVVFALLWRQVLDGFLDGYLRGIS